MSDKINITVAVTGLNAIDSPGPGVSVIRGLKESNKYNIKIIGLAYEILEPGIYMDNLADKVYQIPAPSSGFDQMLERLKYIHQKENLNIIIPNFDAELMTFIKLKSTLNSMGIKMLIPNKEQFEERLKGNLNKFGKTLDIYVPKSKTLFSIDEIDEALQDFEFPIVVKGKFYDAYIAYNKEQCESYFYQISSKWGTPVILQQFIDGNEFNITALGDGKGKMLGAVAMRKTFLTDKGKAWAGISLDDPKLIKMAHDIIEKTKWPGGMEIELIKEKNTNKLYLLEINPRFPAWIYLAIGCGQNHPDMLVDFLINGKTTASKNYNSGKMFIRYAYDLVCDLDKYEKISIYGEV